MEGMTGSRHVAVRDGYEMTITESYEGHGPDDPSGYYYVYDDERVTHWCSTAALAVRFRKID